MRDRCELSDLPTDQCACRIHGPQQEAPPAGAAVFRARFPGQCMECMEGIDVGDHIAAASTPAGDGGYVHEECT